MGICGTTVSEPIVEVSGLWKQFPAYKPGIGSLKALLSLGLSFMLAYLNVFYADGRFIVTTLLQPFFYLMPIFYTIEQVKAKGFYTL